MAGQGKIVHHRRAHRTALVFGHRRRFKAGRNDHGNHRESNEAGQKTSRGLRHHGDTLLKLNMIGNEHGGEEEGWSAAIYVHFLK